MKTVVLIMAGGKGERFWPKSREKRPKQFLDLTGQGTMLQITTKRMQALVGVEDIYVITSREYVDLVREQLPDLPRNNIVIEPTGRNTAPCIGLASLYIRKKYGDNVLMVVVPSDHLIDDVDEYLRIMRTSIKVVEENPKYMATIGISPTSPETGFGYIKLGTLLESIEGKCVYKVERFVEKPDRETAGKYLMEGNYCWNAGMFVFQIGTILDAYFRYVPAIADDLKIIQESMETGEYEKVLAEIYPTIQSISIDYAIMERYEDVLVVPGEFGWDDVGSWISMEKLWPCEKDNFVHGNVVAIDSRGCVVEAGLGEKVVALLGVEDLIIVANDDAILVCSKDRAQDIKLILNELRETKRTKFV